jgi:nitrogen regulatory protein A
MPMKSFASHVDQVLREVCKSTQADFAAFACIDGSEQTLRWKQAYGNRNERYKRIVSPIGKGFCGTVIRSGRPLIVPCFSPKSGDDPCEYPIFVAENLQAIMLVPVISRLVGHGLLLAGSRQPRTFSETELAMVQEAAGRIMDWTVGEPAAEGEQGCRGGGGCCGACKKDCE